MPENLGFSQINMLPYGWKWGRGPEREVKISCLREWEWKAGV